MSKVSYNWSNIIDSILVYGNDMENDSYQIRGSQIAWNLIPQYPNCQILDIFDNIEVDFSPKLLEFFIGENLNLEILLYIEDKRKVVERSLESNMLAYIGPTLKIENSDKGQEVRAIVSLSQKINIEENKNSKCTNYPNEQFKSYKECDMHFVIEYMNESYTILGNNRTTCSYKSYVKLENILNFISFLLQ